MGECHRLGRRARTEELDRRRWLYTAITRAERGLVILPAPDRPERRLAATRPLRPCRGEGALAATAADWLPQLFPQARLAPDRKTLRCADLSGAASQRGLLRHPSEGPTPAGATITPPASAPDRSTIYHATGLTDGAVRGSGRLARLDRPRPRRRARRPTIHWKSPAFSMAASRSPAAPPRHPAEPPTVGPGFAGPSLPPRPHRLRRGARPAEMVAVRAWPTAFQSAAFIAPSCSMTDRRRRRPARRCWAR